MYYILHGDDIVASRNKLNELVHGSEWIVKIDGEKSSAHEVNNSLQSQELFSKRKLILIEKVVKFPKKDLEKYLELFDTYVKNKETVVVIWNDTEFDKKFLQKIKQATIFYFPLPKYFYLFLDSFSPQNSKKLHELLTQLITTVSGEQVYYALIKRLRSLLIIKTGKVQEFKDTKLMSPWQLSKLQKQAQLWSEKYLIEVYRKLFELEIKMKTSQLPLSLENHIDMILLNLR